MHKRFGVGTVVHTSILLFSSFHLRHSYELAITGLFRYRQRNDAEQGKVLFCLYDQKGDKLTKNKSEVTYQKTCLKCLEPGGYTP